MKFRGYFIRRSHCTVLLSIFLCVSNVSAQGQHEVPGEHPRLLGSREYLQRLARERAIASVFETYPGLKEYNTHRPFPMGDGGGRIYGSDRDKVLSSRRILVNQYRDDPAHQVVHAFNELTPCCGSGIDAYMGFLWRDTTVIKGNLNNFKLSHLSPGAGYLYSRSSWNDDTTYFFFSGDNLYSYNGNAYPPERNTGPAPECRIETSPVQASNTDYFLHVLTASDSGISSIPQARIKERGDRVFVTLGKHRINF